MHNRHLPAPPPVPNAIFFAAFHLIKESIKGQAVKAAVLSQIISSFLNKRNSSNISCRPHHCHNSGGIVGVSERTGRQQPGFLKAGPWPGLCFCHSSPAFTDVSTDLLGHGSLYKVIAVAAWAGAGVQCRL